MGNAGQEFLAVLIVFIPRIPGSPQLEAHLFKSLAGIADFVTRQNRDGMVQIALADGIGHIAQPFDGTDDLAGHPARQFQADEDGQQDSQNSQDVKGDLQDVLR